MTDTNQNSHGCDSSDTVTKTGGNVVICDVEGVSATKIPVCKPLIYTYSFSQQAQEYLAAASRWTVFKRLEWSPTQIRGTFLKSYNLPIDAVSSYPDLEQHIPFKLNQYWMGDIEIMVTIVGNPFLVGQLQVGWFYASHLDDKFKYRLTCAGLSQTHHCLISANQGNEALLYVPYKNYRPLINTRSRDNQGSRLLLGSLHICVLNALRVPSGQNLTASVIVHVRFPNSKFSGLVSANLK